jgi:hypothetical protein
MMQAATSLSLTLPIMTCLPVLLRFRAQSPGFTDGESPQTRGSPRDLSGSAHGRMRADRRVRGAESPGVGPRSCIRAAHGQGGPLGGTRERARRPTVGHPSRTAMLGPQTPWSAATDQR